ncbi:MAG: 2-pyrone-4,6-dicarboxylate hydrolase, partial [Bradyrhizobium sp.]
MLRRDLLTTMAGLGTATVLGAVPARVAAEEAKIPSIPGPDPATKTPGFKAPPGSVDTHTHIFGPASTYPFSPTRPYTPPDAPLEMFRA